ncbi:MAG TPA: Nif3-like dinuclear metal center hexameric protein [Pirellulaceae bacterium]|jgi:dinuclear metal center YbgI/SA1388 family protein
MISVADVCSFLEAFAPSALAAEWDNVGLLVGDRSQKVERVMTCLTITPAAAAEAIRERADMIVTHHPLPFKPLKRLTTDQPTGRILLDLIRAGISIYSPHTAFDSAAAGINQQLAEGLGLKDIQPLEPAVQLPAGLGSGRCGTLPQSIPLAQLAARLKQFLNITGLHAVGDLQVPITRVAVACGSAGEFLDIAIARGCDCLVTGETRLHTCYDAESRGITLLLAGHYPSERFAVEHLAIILAQQFPTAQIWPSRDERDPVAWIGD